MNSLPETEHFEICHAHWNVGTIYSTYSIQAKWEKTRPTRIMIPNLAKANSVEPLILHLQEAEERFSKSLAEQNAKNSGAA